MLERAWELKVAIRKWLAATENRDKYSMLQLKELDWDRIDTLLEILKPMEQVTALVGATKSVTIHAVFRLYNHVFSHLETSIAYWETSEKPHANEYLRALNAARNKLDEYYSRTDRSRGTFFNFATLLDPHTKELLYSEEDVWGTTLRHQYVNEFHNFFNENYVPRELLQEPVSTQPRPTAPTVKLQGLAAIGSVKRPVPQPQPRSPDSESKAYLKAPPSDITADNPTADPLRAWPTLESSYPNLALMAKDVLAVPASGVGVEREFNSARDLITYRRCRMKPELIEDLMVIKHHTMQDIGLLSDIVRTAESLVQGSVEIEAVDFTETEDTQDSGVTLATDPAVAIQDNWDIEHTVEWSDSTENITTDDSDSESD